MQNQIRIGICSCSPYNGAFDGKTITIGERTGRRVIVPKVFVLREQVVPAGLEHPIIRQARIHFFLDEHPFESQGKSLYFTAVERVRLIRSSHGGESLYIGTFQLHRFLTATTHREGVWWSDERRRTPEELIQAVAALIKNLTPPQRARWLESMA